MKIEDWRILKTLHIAIILISALLITINSVFAQNVANSTNSIPSNAIRTPNGGWITPLQTTNNSGGNLTIHYEVGKPVTGYANPGPPPDPVFLTDWRGNIDHFLTDHQILLRADVNPEYDVKTRFVEINMTSDTGFTYDDKEQVTFGPNDNHMKQVIWEFIPTLAGNYTVEKFSDGTHTSSTYFSVSDSESMPSTPILVSPLRQFKWGVLSENIQCEPNFVLLTRSDSDNSPVCVKPDTAQQLIERGWTKEIVSKGVQITQNQISNSSWVLSNSMAGLRNNEGIVNWKNQTYYFETPNYTKTTSGQDVRTLFHNVVFTLLPSGFGDIPLGGCEGTHYFTYARFADGTSEELHVFVGSSCGYNYTPIKLSTHTDPQAGLTVYDGKMKLLVNTENK